jgi:hypothetical protein
MKAALYLMHIFLAIPLLDTTATEGSVDWIPPTAGVNVTITSNDFPKVLPEALDKAFRPEAVRNAWGKVSLASV